MSFSSEPNVEPNGEYSDRFARNPIENSLPPRLRPNFRGRGHQNRRQNFRRFGQNGGQQFRQNYRQLIINFNHQSIDSQMSQTKDLKPKYETIVLELNETSDKLSEDFLRQHFQQTYGAVKKIWFNNTNTKAFVSFFNHMSVDMCLESGDHETVNGQTIRVYPLDVATPPELLSTNCDQSFQSKNLCKSDNRSPKEMFPSKGKQKQRFVRTLSRRQLMDLIEVNKTNDKKLLDDILGAEDIDKQMDVLFRTILLNEEELLKRIRLKDYLQDVLNGNGFECRLHFIGSTVNGLGFRDSDIDIFVETFDSKPKTFEESMASLKTIHKILKRTLNFFIPSPIPSLRCPIVRLNFNEMPSIQNNCSEALICDLSLSNALAERNSRLIRLYTQMERRFKQLCILLRFWGKTNGFVGSNHMSSYAFTHLVLFFCQIEGMLPSLDTLRQLSPTDPLVINGWNCEFPEEVPILPKNYSNSDSILVLLEKFFRFYANFDFSQQILSTKTGKTRHKSELWSEISARSEGMKEEGVAKNVFRLTTIISIEDPFDLSHNLCANFNYKTFDKFCEYLSHISDNFKTIFVEKPSQAVVQSFKQHVIDWGLSPLCRESDPTPNGYVFSEHFVGYANFDLILSSNGKQTVNDLIESMANRLIDLTHNWLSTVYKIETLLLSKWPLIKGQLCPFAEFYIKVDNRSFDSNTREEIRKEFSEEEMSFEERETQITERIHKKFSENLEDSTFGPIVCHFGLVMNCRTTFPTVELVLIDLKPGFESSRVLMGFLRRLIAGAANDCRLLTCPKELIST